MIRLVDRPFPLHLAAALLTAIVSRIALFFGSMFVPIPNESGLPISPLTANTALDLGHYLRAREYYFDESLSVLLPFIKFFGGGGTSQYFLPGPVFPSLLQIFDYGPGNTLPLSTAFLLLSVGLVAGWLWWLWRNGVGWIWLYIFALLPTPYWFMLNVSTDLLFAGIVCAFWLLWFNKRILVERRMVGIAVIVVVAMLLRPNAISLLLFLGLDVLIREVALKAPGEARRRGLLFVALIAILLILFGLFYLPYVYWAVAGNAGSASYFGWLPKQYLDGLWPDLPVALNLVLSWSTLLVAKVLYLTGMRPTFGDTSALLVILRMLPGMIMLPGLFWLLFRANWRVRLFIVCFLAPILLGVSQDRYVLPIQPVLFFYGAKAWSGIIQRCLRFRIHAV
jgi:hypothetical protein